MTAMLTQERLRFHAALVESSVLSVDSHGVASNADGNQRTSRNIAGHVATALGAQSIARKLDGQRAGNMFEGAVCRFLRSTVGEFPMLRPGLWEVHHIGGARRAYQLAQYEPYRHLDALANAIEADPTLTAVLGNSYNISPDVVVTRAPEPDSTINAERELVDATTGQRSPMRSSNQAYPIVHAVISCKWTLRSDRAQNARSEALGLIRNRKGRTPHICVVTAEPTPSRLASLALGTGDIDTVYHFALPELMAAVIQCGSDEAVNMLDILIEGQRLRDISDLPLDLLT